MFWALLLIAGIIALVKFPSFRKTIFVIAGVLALAVVGYIVYDKQQTEASKQRVRVEQLEFADMRLGPDSFGSSYKLVGRVKNDSRYTVFGIQAKIHVLDCDDKSNCEVVGEEERDIAPLIPPGQVATSTPQSISVAELMCEDTSNGTIRSPRSEPDLSLQ